MSVAMLGTSVLVPLRRRSAADRAEARGGLVALLRTPGLGRALTTSAIILSAVDLTLVYLPALGAERGLTAATVGALLTVRAVFSMYSEVSPASSYCSDWLAASMYLSGNTIGRTLTVPWSSAPERAR